MVGQNVVRVRIDFILLHNFRIKLVLIVCNNITKMKCHSYCLLVVPDEYNFCSEDIFARDHKSADCIVFDDEFCNSEDSLPMLLSGGQSISFPQDHEFANTAESVSVRKGCKLIIYTG